MTIGKYDSMWPRASDCVYTGSDLALRGTVNSLTRFDERVYTLWSGPPKNKHTGPSRGVLYSITNGHLTFFGLYF